MINTAGPVGLLIACAIGINRTSWQLSQVLTNMIPVDMCIKGMIIGVVHHEKVGLQVYNAASVKIINVLDLAIIGKKYVAKEVPPNMMFWRPGGKVTPWFYEFYLRVSVDYYLKFLLKF